MEQRNNDTKLIKYSGTVFVLQQFVNNMLKDNKDQLFQKVVDPENSYDSALEHLRAKNAKLGIEDKNSMPLVALTVSKVKEPLYMRTAPVQQVKNYSNGITTHGTMGTIDIIVNIYDTRVDFINNLNISYLNLEFLSGMTFFELNYKNDLTQLPDDLWTRFQVYHGTAGELELNTQNKHYAQLTFNCQLVGHWVTYSAPVSLIKKSMMDIYVNKDLREINEDYDLIVSQLSVEV